VAAVEALKRLGPGFEAGVCLFLSLDAADSGGAFFELPSADADVAAVAGVFGCKAGRPSFFDFGPGFALLGGGAFGEDDEREENREDGVERA